jgi:hypothetical protein
LERQIAALSGVSSADARARTLSTSPGDSCRGAPRGRRARLRRFSLWLSLANASVVDRRRVPTFLMAANTR